MTHTKPTSPSSKPHQTTTLRSAHGKPLRRTYQRFRATLFVSAALSFLSTLTLSAQFVPDSLCAVDTLHWTPDPAMQARHAAVLADRNATQLTAATRYGLPAPLATRADAEAVAAGLVPVRTCDHYVVDSLEYSIPFLTPAAASLLDDIATAFATKVREEHLGDYRIIVTSLLRTVEDVGRLRASGNRNAVPNSTHCYATTFDLSYERFYRIPTDEEWRMACGDNRDITAVTSWADPEQLTGILADIVAAQRRSGRCYCIFEQRESCFHITVRTR